MELELKRSDLMMSAATQRGTLDILPPGRNKQQKLCVGDTAGVLHVFSIKKGAIETAFKSLPTGNAISCVVHGQGDSQTDKIFLSFGRTVQGITKKGKEFYRFATGLGEDLRTIAVKDTQLITSGDVGVTVFDNSNEKSFYSCSGRIKALAGVDLAQPAPMPAALESRSLLGGPSKKGQSATASKFVAIVGSHEGKVTAVEDGKVLFTHESDGPISALSFLPDSLETLSGNRFAGKKEVIVGTSKGQITQLFFEPNGITRGWTARPEEVSEGDAGAFFAPAPGSAPVSGQRSAISCVSALDINRDGIDEIVVARENGTIQVFCKDERDQIVDRPVHTSRLEESVSSLGKGFITQPLADELVVQTFSGKVMALGSESGSLLMPLERFRAAGTKVGKVVRGLDDMRKTFQDKGPDVSSGASKKMFQKESLADPKAAEPPRDASRMQLDQVSAEIAELEGHLAIKRSTLKQQQAAQASTSYGPAGAGGNGQPVSTVQPVTQVQMSSVLDRDTGLIDMKLECTAAIDIVTMASSIFLEIIEEELGQWSLTRSRTVASQGQAQFSYVLRPTDQTLKLGIKIRPTEGQAGDITLFIIPKADPCVFRILKHQLPPLSLHIKIPSVDETRPLSELRINGPFSGSDIHAWLGACFEGMAGPRPQQTDTVVAFQNVIMGTQVLARYGDGFAHFRSDNLTTLAILRERLAEEASRNQLRGLNIQVKVSSDSAKHVLSLLWPRLSSLRSIVEKSKLVEALQEIQLSEDDVSFMAEQYLEILANADAIKMTAKSSETKCVYLQGILRDLFIDYWKLSRGSEPTSVLKQLDQLLNSEDLALEQLQVLFSEQDAGVGGIGM